MKGFVAALFVALLSTVFSAVSAQEIRGTLRADEVRGFVVIACYFDPAIQDCDVDRSDVQAVAQSGDSAEYSFLGLQPGYYLVIAWKDTDGDGEMDLDGEDEVAFHMDVAGDPLLVTPPALGVDLVTDSYSARALDPVAAAPTPSAIVGTWSSAHGSAVAYFDSATGSYIPATGSGVEFTFNPDGTYDRFGLLSNSFFSTNNTILVHEVGTYRFDGSTLWLVGVSDTTFYRNGVFDRETKGVAVEWEYSFAIIDADTAQFEETSTLTRVK